MCHYQPFEDDSPPTEDRANRVVPGWRSWQARIAMLETRIARIEARLDGMEARMYFQQKALHFVSVLFLVTLAYALCK